MIDPVLLALGAGAALLLLRKPAAESAVADETVATVGDSLPPIPAASGSSWNVPVVGSASTPAPSLQFQAPQHSDPIVSVTSPPEGGGGGWSIGPISTGSATLQPVSRLAPTGVARLAPGQRLEVSPTSGQVAVVSPPPRPLEILRDQGLRVLYATLSKIRPALSTYDRTRRASDQRLAGTASAQWGMQASEWRKAKARLDAATRLSAWNQSLSRAESAIKSARNEASVRTAILPVNTAASAVNSDISLLVAP